MRNEHELAARHGSNRPALLTFAIGDVHGEYELLRRALEAVASYARGTQHRLVMLGDYIDRGPDSAAVIALLRALQADGARGRHVVCLKGNHEAMAVLAHDSLETAHWLRNGGSATLASYGGTISAADIEWMRSLPVLWSDGIRIYVHGGLEPGIALADQSEERCMWIRAPFLLAPPSSFPLHVVHGHTPHWPGKPVLHLAERLPHRTNLDSGAFRSGVLSVGIFHPGNAGAADEIISIRRRALPPPA